ncbi:MAG: hypothetical protein ACOYBR_09790 [Fluviibacter sp.]
MATLFPNCDGCGAPQGGQAASDYRAAGTYDVAVCYKEKTDPTQSVKRGTRRTVEDGAGGQTVAYLDASGAAILAASIVTVSCPASVDISSASLAALAGAFGPGSTAQTSQQFLVDPGNGNALVVAITTVDTSTNPPAYSTQYLNLDGSPFTGNVNTLQPSAQTPDVTVASMCATLTDNSTVGFLRWFIPGSGAAIANTFDTTVSGAPFAVPAGATVRGGQCVGTTQAIIAGQSGPLAVSAPVGGLPVAVQGSVPVTAPAGGLLVTAPVGGLPVAVPNPLPVTGAVAVTGVVEVANDAGNPLPVTIAGGLANPLPVSLPASPLPVTGTVGISGAVEIQNTAGGPIDVTIVGGLANPLPVSIVPGLPSPLPVSIPGTVTTAPAAATAVVQMRHKNLTTGTSWGAADVTGTLQSLTVTVLDAATATVVDAEGGSVVYPPGSWTWGVERDRDASLQAGTIAATTGRSIVHWTELAP